MMMMMMMMMMKMNCLVLCSLTLLSTLIRVMLLNSRTSSKNYMAMGRLLYLVDIVFVVTIIFMPLDFGTFVVDSLLMGLYSSLASKMTGFFQNIRNLESELELKVRDIDTAEAKTISERKQSEELVLERDRLLESSGTRLKHLESVLETKRRDIAVAEANAATLQKQLEELLLEYDVLLERNQSLRNESELLKTTVEQLESELETRTGDVGIAEAKATTMKKLLEEFILDYDVLRERNLSLRIQSDSMNTRVIKLESELETRTKDVSVAEANNVTLKKQFEDSLLENDRLSESNQVLNNQLLVESTSEEIESLKNQLRSSETKLKQVETENKSLRNKLHSSNTTVRQYAELAESNNDLIKENQRLKKQLKSSEIKLKQAGSAEATSMALRVENQSLESRLKLLEANDDLREEIQSLENRLKSSEIKLRQVGSAEATLRKENESLKCQLKLLETKLKQVESALRKENQSSKQSSATKSVKEAKAGNSAAENFGRFLFDQF